jgi:mediator of RNA polymerase II transcription subunit 18
VEGHRFVVNNTVLYLHRVLQWPSPPSTASINAPLPPFPELKPLDSSGAYVLEAKIRLSGSNPSLIKLGEDELIGFRTRMKGVIDMKSPERLALDTRVK